MGISSIGSITTPNVDPYDTQRPQATIDFNTSFQLGSRKSDAFRSDFGSLLSAIQSGDVTSAQSALQTLQSNLPSTAAVYTAPGTTSQNPVASDLSSLFSAVKSGDLSAAQSALDQFKADVTAKFQSQAQGADQNGQTSQQVHGHHHHHHHSGGGLESLVSSALNGSSDSTNGSSTDSSSTVSSTQTAS